jgi:purine-nucleoside phosphorylase
VNAYELARSAADTLLRRAGTESFHIALVMGSGWAPAADLLGSPADEIAYSELPGFTTP